MLTTGLGLEKYPHIFMPPDGTPFDRNGLKNSVGSGGSTTAVKLDSVQLQPGYVGWLKLIGLSAGDYSFGYMQLRMGGVALRDYANIVTPIGAPETPREVLVRIADNYALELWAVPNGSIAVPIRWTLWGWYYSKTWESL